MELAYMSETTGGTLRRWLLAAVADLDGMAQRAEVHARVENLYGDKFTAQDRAPRSGRPAQEPAWRNNLDSLYDRLKKQGVMLPSKARDPWRLSDIGLKEAASYTVVDEIDLLAYFKPSDGGNYRSRFKEIEIIKKRHHDPLLRKYGEALSAMGWQPLTTTVYPRDLELRRQGQVWLVEVKVLYRGNATEAVRAALAQLLEYRHYYYDRKRWPMLMALFSESIGDEHVRFLESLGIASTWRNGIAWLGSDTASTAGLVPIQDVS
jgi:hypothetical protein